MKPTKEQFEEYVEIRNSGMCNMYDIRRIEFYSDTGLNRKICSYIMQHFMELATEYDVEV